MATTARAFADLWRDRVQQTPNYPFLIFQDAAGPASEWSYGDFDALVGRARGWLRSERVRRGDAVHVALRNCPMFVVLWLACALEGAWFVPVDPASSERDLARQMGRVQPRLGVCGRDREAPYRAAARAAGVAYRALDETVGDVDTLSDEHADDVVVVDAMDRLAVMFTSGTTSQPKGVVLTQANYHHVALSMSQVVDLRPAHRWYVTLPLFHANAQYYCIAPAIAAGASVALTSRFSASAWVQGAADLSVTHASLFAAPIRMILARTPSDAPPLQLQHVWFAQSLGRQHYEQFAHLTGTRPRQLYGMTETVAIVTADDPVAPVHDLIGRPIGRAVRLMDLERGVPAAPGESGMIQVAGERGVTLFVEYLDDPEVTARSFELDADGTTWLKTGDLAIDAGHGVLRFVGRSDDVIKVAGENVSLSEVEASVAQAPGVLEAAIVAKEDPVRDVVPVAYVVARDPAAPPSTEDLADWAATNLPPSARPREWWIIDALPRTSVGKVRRFAISSGLRSTPETVSKDATGDERS